MTTAWLMKCGCSCVARFCAGGIIHSAPLGSGRASLGARLGHALAPLQHTCGLGARSWHSSRPSAAALLLPRISPPQQPYFRPPSGCVAALSSFGSASDLSAAIATAPTAAALQGLAASVASTPHQEWLLQQYKVQLLPRLDEEPADTLVKVLLFFAKLGPGHAELFEQSVPVLYNRLGQLAPHDLVGLLSAYSAAAQHSPSAYSHELFAALTEFLWEGLGALGPGALADVAGAYAGVEHYDDDDDFFAGVAAAAMQQLEAFCPEDLSRLLLALAKLRYAAPQLGAAALAQMAAQLEGWPLSSVGRLLQALATMQAPADPCVLERVATHVSNTLRNLRTSTDGKQLLASLSARPAAAAAATAAPGGTLPGLSGGGSGGGGSPNTRLSPSWQGFGMTRSSSSDAAAAGDGDGGGGGIGAADSSSSSSQAAASIWAAANSSSSMYEYGEPREDAPPPAAGALGAEPPPQADESEMGPDYVTVTSYGADGSVTKTYIKKPRDGSSGGSSSIGGVGGVGSNGAKPPPGTRAIGTTSRSWQRGSANSSSGLSLGGGGGPGGSAKVLEEACAATWQWSAAAAVSSDCRPVYDDAASLAGALVSVVWAFAMLGHMHANMAKECLKGLSLVAPEALRDEQLAMLWAAHMRYQQLGHVVLDPNPLLAESYSVFAREISRAAPRTIALPSSLQPLAAANWLLKSTRQAPEYQTRQQEQEQQRAQGQQQPLRQDQQQQQQHHHHQLQQQQSFSSWKYRDPAVLTAAGLEASVRQVLEQAGLPVQKPNLTLDGLERVGLPLKHNGVCIAFQVLPPAWCARNPPHAPTVEAQAHMWALQYRGYTVLQVPFHEWASVLESGDGMVALGYLQRLLDSVAAVRAPHVSNF